MSVIRLTPDGLAAMLEHHKDAVPAAINGGVTLAAHRGRALLVRRSPVDQGVFKNSWQVRDMAPIGALLFNDAPHAGIIEQGARPHAVNREGIDALTAWVKRKLQVQGRRAQRPLAPRAHRKQQLATLDSEARSIAFAIAAKLKKEGQKGLFLVANAMPELVKFLQQEIDRRVKQTLEGK